MTTMRNIQIMKIQIWHMKVKKVQCSSHKELQDLNSWDCCVPTAAKCVRVSRL